MVTHATATSTPPPLQGARLLLGGIAVSLATFMVVLDGAIANVAIPTIAGNLGVSPNQGTWVITSFAVANAVSMPLTGWMAQRFGQVRLFVGALLLFVLASLLCGLAPSIELLVFFRIIQGAAAGPMVPMSQALLLSIVPRAQAGMAMAMWGLVIMVAPVMGPVVGGWLSDTFSWPWIFLINVPFGLVAAGYTWKLYRDRETPTQRRPIDGIGLALLVLWVGALQIMLDKGRELDWFDSSFIVMLATLSVVGFAFFIIWERYEKNPIVDLSLFRERSFATSTVVLSLGHGALLGNTVLIPLWLQTQLGYSATDAGLVMAPVGLLSILLAPVVGRNLQRFDPRAIATIGFVVFALVFFMRSHFTTTIDTWTLTLPSYIQGVAMATYFSSLTLMAFQGVSAERLPLAAGLNGFARTLCIAFSTSIATTAWDVRSTFHHARLMESAHPYNPVFTSEMARLNVAQLEPGQNYSAFEHLASVQASMLGANDVFWFSTILFLVLAALLWIAKPAAQSNRTSH